MGMYNPLQDLPRHVAGIGLSMSLFYVKDG